MSFGGGNIVPNVTKAHVHSNAVGEGGALSVASTLIDSDVLSSKFGKWSSINTATFRNSVLVGTQVGTVEET